MWSVFPDATLLRVRLVMLIQDVSVAKARIFFVAKTSQPGQREIELITFSLF
jgi:hypothetical protein